MGIEEFLDVSDAITKTCLKCGINKPASQFPTRDYGHYVAVLSRCRECRVGDRAVFRFRNADRLNAENRSAWKSEDAGKRAARRASASASKRRLREEVLAAYGSRCACCGESEPCFLSVDHIHNDGVAHRKEVPGWRLYTWLRIMGFPKDRFQLLCHNCNFSKGRYGNCPHEVARFEVPYAVNTETE